MRDLPLLDLNVTLGCLPGVDQQSVGVKDVLTELDRLGAGAALVRHADAISYDAVAGNATLIDEIRNEPRLAAAFVVGPLDCGEHGGPGGFTAHLDEHRVHAVWLYPRSHGWSLTGPESVTLLEQLRTCGRPVFVDLDECDWAAVAYLAGRLPDTDVVACGTGYRTLRQGFAVLGAYPRVRLDTSFLAAHEGLEAITARFGAHRLCFGTGFPIRDAGGARYRLACSGLADADRRRIGAATAAALLRVEEPEPRDPMPLPAPPAGGIVDAHAHIGLWPSSFLPAPGAEALVASMERTSTAVTIISGMRALWSGEVRTGNAEALEAARRHGGRIYVHAVANPHRPQDRGYLADLLALDEVRGIKVHPHTHSCALDDRRYDWIFDLAGEQGAPVLGHSFGGTWHSDPSQFGVVAGRHPDVVLIAGHAGANPDGYLATIVAAQQHPNLCAEICGSTMTGRWLRRIVASIGADRVLHGTDATLIDPRYGVGRVLHAGLKDHERDLVLAANARRLYRLDPDDN